MGIPMRQAQQGVTLIELMPANFSFAVA